MKQCPNCGTDGWTTYEDGRCPNCEVCPDCGNEMEWENCWRCEGDGGWSEELIYPPDKPDECYVCNGEGGFWICNNC